MSEDEAVKLLHDGLRVWLFSYRSLDCLSTGRTWWNADHIWLKAKADVRVQMKCRQTIFAIMVKLIGSVAQQEALSKNVPKPSFAAAYYSRNPYPSTHQMFYRPSKSVIPSLQVLLAVCCRCAITATSRQQTSSR